MSLAESAVDRCGSRVGFLASQPVGHRLRLGEQRLLLGGVVGGRVGGHEVVELTVGDAVERRRAADAARVEADDVEVAAHLRADDGVGGRGVAHRRRRRGRRG